MSLSMLPLLEGAVVECEDAEYVVLGRNADDTVTLLYPLTGRVFDVPSDAVVVAPAAAQAAEYLVRCLVMAWEPRLEALAQQHVQRLLSWRQFAPGDPAAAAAATRAFTRLWKQPRMLIDDGLTPLDL